MTLIGVFILLVFVHSLISRRLERTVLTAPILFTVAGMLTLLLLPGERGAGAHRELLLWLAEIGLVMTLFTDATSVTLSSLRGNKSLPLRLLSTGMLLTILLGLLGALLVFRRLSLWEAGILASVLAPTDAGLGQIIVSSPRVPMRIRQALNVEAGLNDGLSVPFMMFFIALAHSGSDGAGAVLTRFVVEEIGYGLSIGLVIGITGGSLLGLAHRRGWAAGPFQQLGLVTLPLLCVIASEPVGASMFIAAFFAGLVVQIGFKEAGKHSVEFTEHWGQLLNFLVFFVFGLLVARGLTQITFAAVLYAVLSLTVVRMLPVAVALIGTRLSKATVLFMGWFGPRGLASIVLGLVYLEQESKLPGESTICIAVTVTVLISIFAHGLSALPGISLYARKISTLGSDAAENRELGQDSASRPV
jgi:sodium/hydrogen antiporter